MDKLNSYQAPDSIEHVQVHVPPSACLARIAAVNAATSVVLWHMLDVGERGMLDPDPTAWNIMYVMIAASANLVGTVGSLLKYSSPIGPSYRRW